VERKARFSSIFCGCGREGFFPPKKPPPRGDFSLFLRPKIKLWGGPFKKFWGEILGALPQFLREFLNICGPPWGIFFFRTPGDLPLNFGGV